MVEVERIHPLKDQQFASNGVLMKPKSAQIRISLRADEPQYDAINKVLSINLPNRPKTSNTHGHRIAMWLGPDEWLILDDTGSNLNELPANLASTLCSAVDVSHRNTAIEISGVRAATAISSGCPQNLNIDNFPIGACSRTVLGKVEIILLRSSADTFHIECWRSFSDYVWKYLVDAAKTL